MSGTRTGLRAAVTAALFVCAAAGGAVAQAPAPAGDATGVLASGVTYALHPDAAQSAAAVALWYRAPAGGFGGTPVPGLSRLAAATVTASTPITGTPLAQLVDRWGGRISVSAYPDSVAVTVLVPPDHVAQAVRAMTGSFFAPVTTAQGLAVAQRYAAEDAVFRSFGPDAIEDALGAALFADGPVHDGTIGSAASVAEVELERVRAFAERAFRPANAILVLTGNVDARALENVASRAGTPPPAATPPSAAGTPAAGAEPAAPQTPRAAAAPVSREGNVAGTGLGWLGPPITAEADATALDFVADALFAAKTGTVSKALAGRKATVTGKFITYHDPGIFVVTITGEEAAAARPVVEKAVADAAKPMAPAAFEAARAAFVYRLLGQLETPSDIADTYGWYTVEGDAAYAPADGGTNGRYFTLAAQLTPAVVAHTAAKYLGAAPAVVTLVKAPPARGART